MYRAILATLLAAGSAQAVAKPQIKVVMSVDWEGDHLKSDNIEAFRSFRSDFPDLPLVQYLNAAYYTKPDADAGSVTATIASVVTPQDQLGLHIHGLKTLFEAAGVPFRTTPSWEPGSRRLTAADCVYDCGHQIPISAYTTSELRQVIRYSTSLLSAHGFGQAVHFRSGGWMGADNVLAALAAESFASDSSAANVPRLAPRLTNYPLTTWLTALWPNVSDTTQPYQLTTSAGTLLEMPDNGALADYVTAAQMLAELDHNIADAGASGTRWLVVGFHQETCRDWISRVRGFLAGVAERRSSGDVDIVFTTMPSQQP